MAAGSVLRPAVALTLTLMLRPLFLRSELAGVEVAADDQAVRWGASPRALADVLDRLDSREMEVPLPADRWLLTRLLLLLRPRTVRLRVLKLREAPAPVGEGRQHRPKIKTHRRAAFPARRKHG